MKHTKQHFRNFKIMTISEQNLLGFLEKYVYNYVILALR